MSLVYALIPFLNTLVLLGFETAFFRFVQKKGSEKAVYNTIITTLIISTILITSGTLLFRESIATFIGITNHPDYIIISAFIIACDALSAIPFALLRHENRPKKFAFIRICGILINMRLTFFLSNHLPCASKVASQ